ncbi:hypothetical protein Tco_1150119, partial [Tanacetum coccineum]
LKAHKLLFKDVVGQLVKKVKALELKLRTRSRKVVMSESDKEEEEEQDTDPLIKLAKAVAASDAHVDVSPGADIPPSPPLPTGSLLVFPLVFLLMEEDRLGEEAAKNLFEEEHADLERQRAEMQRKRQQDVLDSAKYYTDADWTDTMGHIIPPVDSQQPSESSSQPHVSMSSGPEKKGHTYGTRRKSLGTRKKSSTALDLDVDDRSFIRVLSDDDSDDDDDPVIVW